MSPTLSRSRVQVHDKVPAIQPQLVVHRAAELLFAAQVAFGRLHRFRGVVLSLFLTRDSKPAAVFIAAVSFGAVHLLNLMSGQEVAWVLGQAAWATIIGLFYGVLVLKSNSLWPAMLVHYLGNLFIAPFTWYLQTFASATAQAVYGIVFSLGLVPTTLMILWVLLFTRLWPIQE